MTKLTNSIFATAVLLAASFAHGDTCDDRCLEMASECNQECPMDFPDGPACHLACQVAYDRCAKNCHSSGTSLSLSLYKEQQRHSSESLGLGVRASRRYTTGVRFNEP
jgi:hypothetical protein